MRVKWPKELTCLHVTRLNISDNDLNSKSTAPDQSSQLVQDELSELLERQKEEKLHPAASRPLFMEHDGSDLN